MNERIKELALQAMTYVTHNPKANKLNSGDMFDEKFAELIVRECARLNRLQSYELMGVITDVEEGDGFDDVCLNTVKRVAERLANDLKEHFGVEE
jgi:hypothetical protein